MENIVVDIKNLQKFYGEKEILKDINLEIENGDIYGLIGRSGAGKSTLLRCINGLTNFQSGDLIVNGRHINQLSNEELRNTQREMGMIFQNFSLISQKTIYDNIALPMKHWNYSKNEINQRVNELAEIVGIKDKLQDYPKNLSGGQQQRVGIARALTLNPKIILSDEATSALDPVTTKQILDLLKSVNQELGLTMVVVTHEIDVIKSICNKTAILEYGEIAVDGYTREIFMEEPEALQRLIALDKSFNLDKSSTAIKIKLYNYNSHETLISDIYEELEMTLAIKDYNIDQLQDSNSGYIIAEVKVDKVNNLQSYLTDKNIEWGMV